MKHQTRKVERCLILILLAVVLFSYSISNSDTASKATCVSTEEKNLYQAIMQYRKKKKLKGIPYSAQLTKVAQAHVKDLATYYDYNGRVTCNPHSWSEYGSWSSCCYTADHKEAKCMWSKPREITGYTRNGYEIVYYNSTGAHAKEGLEGWIKSRQHNALLINSGIWKKVEWKSIGVGIYKEYGAVWFGEIEDEDRNIVVCE